MIGETLRPIAEDVAKMMGVSLPELYSARRHKTLVAARHAAIWLSARCTPYPLAVIGRHFHRDHTTIQHALDQINKRRAEDAALAARLDRLQAKHEMAV